MKKASKKFFGILGLVVVAITTIIATNLPTYATNSSDVEVRVNVNNAVPSVLFNRPLDSAVFTSGTVQVEILYNQATDINYSLTVPDGHGGTIVHPLPSRTVATTPSSGIDVWDLDISSFTNYGTFVIRAEVDGHPTAEDLVSIDYSAVDINIIGTVDQGESDNDDGTGNPLINITPGANIDSVIISIIDPITNTEVSCSNGSANSIFTLGSSANPFTVDALSRCDLPDGEYVMKITPITNDLPNGNPRFVNITYKKTTKPNNINVPNTGGLSIAGLTFSKMDSFISLAIIFTATIIFFFIVSRKKKSRR